MHNKLFEDSSEDSLGIKDGGFVFQAILSYDMRWTIVDGESKYDQRWVEGKLHQVDVYPDLKFMEGYATLNYVILSEVNLFKRKLDLATEYIKMAFSKGYADEMNGRVPTGDKNGPITGGIPDVAEPEQWNYDFTDALKKAGEQTAQQGEGPKGEIEGEEAKQLGKGQEALPAPSNESDSSNLPATTEKPGLPATTDGSETGSGETPTTPSDYDETDKPRVIEKEPEPVPGTPLTEEQKKAINDKYFKGTRIDITFQAKRVVLREISTSSVDSGRPSATLKLSTGMVDTLDGKPINSWDNFKIYASGAPFDGMIIDNNSTPPISKATMYDPIENVDDLIFRTILPSVILEFSGDSVKIDTYNNRSAQVGFTAGVDFENIFKDSESTPVIEPNEGEETEEQEESEEEETEESNLPAPVTPPSEKG
jgi:hypothetical protein